MPTDNLRVDVLLGVIAFVYLAAFAFAVHAIARRRKRDRRPLGRAFWWVRTGVVTLALLGIACFGYARWIEPYWLEVTHVRVATAKLPRGTRPIRIAQISDVHCDPEVRLEDRLPDAIAAEHPDVIVFTGDAINDRAALPTFRTLMSRLAAIAPTYAVRGNWDVWYWSDLDLFGGTGAIELASTAQHLPIASAEVWIAGLPVGDEGKLARVVSAIPAGAISVLLFHYPDEIEHASTLGIDLYLAGHTHGGQVALPWYGALVTYSKFDKRYEAGRYEVGPTTLYVNRGIGMEGGRAPRIRFFARPEITIVELVPPGT